MYAEEQWNRWFDELAHRDFVVIDQILPSAVLEELRVFFEGNISRLEPAKIGSAQTEQRKTEIRSDFTFWLDPERDRSMQLFFEWVQLWMERISRELFLGLQGFEFHLAQYPPGGFYKAHLDQFDTKSNRMISMVIYLNSEWTPADGGALRIHHQNEPLDIEPIWNRGVVFRSDKVLHEVLPSNKERRSLTGWLLKRPGEIGVLGF